MQIVKPHGEFVALTRAEAAKVNDQINTIYNDHNGNLTDFNINSLANISQSKILNLQADLNVIRAERITEVNVVLFQANGTYIKPIDLRFAKIIVIGGGGGGGGATSSAPGQSAGGGGGSGQYGEGWYAAGLIQSTEVVIIGVGGAGGGLGAIAGGTTTFGSLLGAGGGAGGTVASDSIGAGGPGGIGGTAQILTDGVRGESSFITSSPFALARGGSGGAKGPYMTPGVAASVVSGSGALAGSHGALGGGGSGAASVGLNAAVGGSGGSGLVIVIEFKA